MAKIYKKKATRVRGGFSHGFKPSRTPFVGKPLVPANINKQVGKMIETSSQRRTFKKGRSYGSSYPTQTGGAGGLAGSCAKTLAALAAEAVVLKVGKEVIEKVGSPRITGRGKPAIATSISKSAGVADPSSTIGRNHKTTFDTGKYPTSTVKRVGKNNGTEKFIHYDTSVNNRTSNAELQLNYGFNQKCFYWWDQPYYWTINDLKDIAFANAGTPNESLIQWQTAYWLTKNFFSEYKFLNQNKYLKTKIKIHFFRQDKLQYEAVSAFSDFATASTGLATPRPGQIPIEYQLAKRETSGALREVATDPYLARIGQSRAVNSLFTKVKTFSKTLNPGEVWTVRHTHHTGPGIRVNDILYEDVTTGVIDGGAAAFYYPVIEVVGPQVECYESTNTLESYIGTGSGSVRVEFKKGAEIVNGDTDTHTDLFGGTGYKVADWAFRVYNEPRPSRTSSQKVHNVAYSEILKEGEVAAAGKYIIPVTTDLLIKRAGKEVSA